MNRIAAIGDIVIVDDATFGVEQYDLGSSGTRVDAEKGIEDGNILSRFNLCLTQILFQRLGLSYQPIEISSRKLALGHSFLPSLIVGSILEDGSHGTGRRDALHIVCCANLIDQGIDAQVFFRRDDSQGSTFGRQQRTSLGKNHFAVGKMHVIDKSLAQSGNIGQRSSAEEQGTLDLAAMSQRHDCLNGNSTEDGSGNVLTRNILGNEVLYIGLTENTATRSNRINLFGLQGKLIELVHRTTQDNGHLVDKCTGTTGTLTIHAKIASLPVVEEDHFRILATDVNHRLDIRIFHLNAFGGCDDLLHKRQTDSFCYTHTDRARDAKRNLEGITDLGLHVGKNVNDTLDGSGQMTDILIENHVAIAIQGNDLGSGRAYIDSESQSLYIHSFKHI